MLVFAVSKLTNALSSPDLNSSSMNDFCFSYLSKHILFIANRVTILIPLLMPVFSTFISSSITDPEYNYSSNYLSSGIYCKFAIADIASYFILLSSDFICSIKS